ncbi:hypothetical protein [Salmonella phage PHA46]
MYIDMYTEVAFCEALQQLYVSIEVQGLRTDV